MARSSFILPARAAGLAGSTMKPFLPFSMISGTAPTRVAITGNLAAMASIKAQGKPSLTEGRTNMSKAGMNL